MEYNSLADECNRIMSYLSQMPEEERYAWVMAVLDWIINMYKELQDTIAEAQNSKLGKIAMAKKLQEFEKKYRPMIEQKRPEIIVALTYAIKPEYQEKLAPLLYAIMGLV